MESLDPQGSGHDLRQDAVDPVGCGLKAGADVVDPRGCGLDAGPNAVESVSRCPEPAEPLNGLDLLRRAREGSRDALNILFEQSRRCILAVIRRRLGKTLRAHVESGDILQVTLMRAFQRIEQFEGKSFESLVAWLARIAKNAIRDEVDYLRRQRRSVLCTVSLDSVEEARSADTLSALSHLVARQEAERLERALSCLEAMQRNVVLWRKYEELSFREIGERLGKSPDACRMLLARALKTLGRKLRSKPAPGGRNQRRSTVEVSAGPAESTASSPARRKP